MVMDLTPVPMGLDVQVNTTTANSQVDPAVAALDGGGFVVTWSSFEAGYWLVNGQRYAADGTALGGEFRANIYSIARPYPSVTALDGGGFVVTWASGPQDGSDYGIFGRRYAADGTALGSEFRANTYTTSAQIHSSVAGLDGGGFVVTWSSIHQDGSVYGIYGQRYDATGAAAGTEFRVNTETLGTQIESCVTALAGGGFVVTWSSFGQDGSGYGIYGQRYAADGTALGGEFRANTVTSSDQRYPSVVALAGGGFVVTWSSYDGNQYGIYGQRYAADGTALGSEFRANTFTSGDQVYSSVAALADGGFVVTWSSANQDGNDYGVYGQRFSASGMSVGSEFRLNATTAGRQIADTFYGSETVAALEDGRLVQVWSGSGTEEVFYRLVDVPDPLIRVISPEGATFQTTTLSSTPVAPNVASNFAWTGSGAAPAVASDVSFYPPTHTLTGINDGVYGNSSSYLHSAPFWVKIDLGTGRVFDQLSLGRDRLGVFNDRDPGQFRVYVSADEAVYANGDAANDTSEYTLVYDSGVNGYSGLVNGNETVTAKFAPVLGRYVKVEFYTGTAFLEPAIDEIQVRRSYELLSDDVFVANALNLVSGTVLDGSIGTDTLRITGGGTVDLTSGVTLTSIEQIELAGPGNTTAIVTAAQAALITSAAGANDVVQIASGSASEALVADLILDAGVERVEWSIPGFASTVEAVPDGLGGFIISYDDGDDVQPWDTIDAQYDSLGRKVAQTNDYDLPGPEGGVTLNFTYDPATGFATTIVNTDGHLTRTFSTITTTLENGVVTKVDTLNDNGTLANTDDTLVEQFFTAGVITRERTTDTSSANAGKPWLYQDREYGNDGVLHTTTQIFRTFWDAGVNGGGQHVVGAAGSQVIEGVATGGGVSATNDALIGGAGADTFRFVDGFGHDTIYDFVDGTDLLDLTGYGTGIDTLAELQAAASITQVAFGSGFNTVIAFNGTSDQITIRNFTVAQLGDGDFAV